MRRAGTLLGLGLLAALAASAPSSARGQVSAQDRALAREQFRLGMAASSEERWEDALAAFEAAYRAAPRPEILLNLGTVQGQLGRVVAASESYERFLREARGGPLAPHVPAAEDALAAVRARIGRVTIHLDGTREGDEVRVDGMPFVHLDVAAPFDPAPVAHRLTVRRGTRTLVERTFIVPEGGALRVAERIATEVPTPAQVARAAGPDDPASAPLALAPEAEGEDLAASPVLWTIVAVVVLGAAAAITAALLVTESSGTTGNLGLGRTIVD